MSDATGFLYPMLDGGGSDRAALLDDLASSASQKIAIHDEVVAREVERWAGVIDDVADAIAATAAIGRIVLTMGNGGSATDADGAAAMFATPPRGLAVAARSLVADVAVITALANDIGYERVFARQIIAHGREGDVLIGYSTSGNSPNLLAGFTEARSRGLTTVGLAGDRGGAMADSDDIDHLVVVDAPSIHRIQETHAAVTYVIWLGVQDRLERVTATEERSG